MRGLALTLCAVLASPALANGAPEIRIGDRLFTEAEIAEGAAIFERRCSQCHGLDGKNYKAPYLNGVVGRPSASIETWEYSPAMKGFGGVWTVENLQTYLTKPKAFIPDVAMNFIGFKAKTEDRDKVIAYLVQVAGAAGQTGGIAPAD